MHASYTLQQVAEIVAGKIIAENHPEKIIDSLLTDSRKASHTENALFFAIKGLRNDGHRFVEDLCRQGVHNFIVSENKNGYASLEANFILVDDTLKAMQDLASSHRKQFSFPVIGITGSNGKTIIKEWLYQLLHKDKKIVRSPKSYNSQIGVPLSVWQMNAEHQLGIFEAGISMPGEMDKLEKIIHPDIGIFTNIGYAHRENFENQEQIIEEKLRLFSHSKQLIYCKDYRNIHQQVNESNELDPSLKLFTWSRKTNAELKIGRIAKEQEGTSIQGIFNNNFIYILIPFTDEASIENAIHCWALMLMLGYEQETIEERMANLAPVAMRLELKEGTNNCSIINDSYNSDIGSLSIALDFLNQQKQHSRKTLILSDILESGVEENTLYKQVADLAAGKGVSRIIGVGPAISRQQQHFGMDKIFFESTSDFIRHLALHSFRDETILLKGARTFGFERISKALQQKAHETVLEINLNAIVHNLNFFKSRLKPETKIMAMVKAFSYGSGSFEIASVLEFHQADYFAVAYADEGMELRKAGITLPIMVMNPEEQGFETMINYELEPEIYSFSLLNKFADTAARMARENEKSEFKIHLKVETGMNRLGFEEEHIPELIVRLKNFRQLKVQSVFSHLAASEESVHDKFTHDQLQKFSQISERICSAFPYKILRHILNTGGIIRFSDFQFDMVRLGIGLYGVSPTEYEQKHLHQAATLKTTISQVKNVAAGETIGYGRKGKTNGNMIIGIVGIGYADGLSRRLGNGNGKMLVNGKFAKIVSNVCMDMCMIDITDIPTNEGDEVIVFGNDYPVTEMAKDADTIPYEILATISQRVKRIYFHE